MDQSPNLALGSSRGEDALPSHRGEERSVVPFARNPTLSARMERALGECMSETLKIKIYDALNVVKFFYDASQLQSSFMMLGCMMLGAGGICCMMLGTAKHHKI